MTVPLTLVVNPAAGGGKPASYLPIVTAVLDGAGASYTVSYSTSLQHACALAAQAAARGETVVAFGGDGLTGALAGPVAQAVNGGAGGSHGNRESPGDGGDGGMHGAGEPAGAPAACFGIIPAGRGNDFARTMRIPFDPAAAARLLLDGRPQPVDLLAVTGAGPAQAPTIVAGSVYVGIASVAGEIANRTRFIRGPLVYNVAALRALAGWKATRFRIETKGPDGRRDALEFRGYVVVVANTPFFGAGMKVAPAARYDDGLLDIVLMRHGPKLAFVRALMKIKDGSHVTLAQVSTGRAAELTLAVDRPMPVGADGEVLAISAPLSIRAMPAALSVLVPR
jgi:YegS/Rv2252/BmrU family lipid kinase